MTDDSTDTDESAVESLAAAVSGDDSNEDGSLGDDVGAVVTMLQEAEEIIDAIDVSELPEAVDADQVREAIEVGEVPDALRDDENAVVVKLRRVIRAIDLGQTLASMDVTDVWESTRSIDDATDELDDSDGDLTDADLDRAMDVAAEELKEGVDVRSGDMAAYQAVIQQRAMEGVDAFREALLRTHGQFERIVEANRERMRQRDRQPSSRNPTAVSTIPSGRSDVSSVPNYATMPRPVRHSDAPTRTHIYGDRFRREREKRGYD
ncbi:hypothetical protein [Halovivax limisalsi]|uniref:hypothetical protein n=1 Tax=Halovivax limisalsi TaxID=1453760 RepID=UPI001FFD7950|nr:hypothetical protein [Halovivax limisalsi]